VKDYAEGAVILVSNGTPLLLWVRLPGYHTGTANLLVLRGKSFVVSSVTGCSNLFPPHRLAFPSNSCASSPFQC